MNERDSQRGWVSENDICFWMLTGAYKDGVLDHLAFYIPFIWVTNAYTMATGREAYGYPRNSSGWAQLASSPDDPGPLWADGMVLAEYSPETQVTRQPLLSMTKAELLAGAPQAFGGRGEAPGGERAARTANP